MHTRNEASKKSQKGQFMQGCRLPRLQVLYGSLDFSLFLLLNVSFSLVLKIQSDKGMAVLETFSLRRDDFSVWTLNTNENHHLILSQCKQKVMLEWTLLAGCVVRARMTKPLPISAHLHK